MADGGHSRRRVHGGDVCGPLVLLFFQLRGTGSMPPLYCCTRRTWDWQQHFQARALVERGKTNQLMKQCAHRAVQRPGEPVLHPMLLKNESQAHDVRLSSSGASIHTLTPTGRQTTATHEQASLLLVVIDIVVLLGGALCHLLSLA